MRPTVRSWVVVQFAFWVSAGVDEGAPADDARVWAAAASGNEGESAPCHAVLPHNNQQLFRTAALVPKGRRIRRLPPDQYHLPAAFRAGERKAAVLIQSVSPLRQLKRRRRRKITRNLHSQTSRSVRGDVEKQVLERFAQNAPQRDLECHCVAAPHDDPSLARLFVDVRDHD